MKKKTVLTIAGILAAISLMLCLNVIVGQKKIESAAYSEMESRGYPADEIADMKMDHSYFRHLMGYNEWRISVEFEKVPNVFFWFSYKNDKIIYEGVSSEPMMDKEAMIDYSEKFKSGTLLGQ